MTETSAAPRSTNRARTIRRAVGVIAAALAAVLVWLIAVPLIGLDLAANQQGAAQQIGLGAVLSITTLAGLAGWALLALLERFTSRGRQIWTIIALVVLALSMLGPIAGGIGLGTKVVLSLMHLVVGAILIIAFTGSPAVGDARRSV